MVKTLIQPKSCPDRRKNVFNQTCYSESVSEAEANFIFALRRGQLPRLLWDDPAYIEDSIIEGFTIAKMQDERAQYEETWDALIRQAKRVIKMDKKRRKTAKKYTTLSRGWETCTLPPAFFFWRLLCFPFLMARFVRSAGFGNLLAVSDTAQP